jgi:NAD(P)-dependent dehydrogenase (short-subunit alcohol dehydrogenase family)
MTTIALITGANKGIGLETARLLGARGMTVLLGCRDEERGRAAEADLRAGGADAHAIGLDVTDEDGVRAAAKRIDDTYGLLDILVNNAGIAMGDGDGRPSGTTLATLRTVFDTNVFGVVAVTNAMLPLLRRSAAGYIGNVSSGLGTIALLTDHDSGWAQYANLLGYNSSKAALNAVTLIYARSLAADGIRVNALSPGFVATDLNRHTGHLPAAQGGANIAEQILRDGTATGQFLSETGGTHPW